MDHLISADATKLIAADSFLIPRTFRDPESRVAFEDITNVLANGLRRYFYRTTNLKAEEFGPVGTSWIRKPDEQGAPDLSPSDASTDAARAASINMNLDIAHAFARTFLGAEQQRAIDWVCFQSNAPDLMRIFWNSNTEEQMLDPYRFLIDHQFALQRLRTRIRRSLRDNDFRLVEQSNRALADLSRRDLKASWTDEDLVVAYLVWNYLKGYRYAANLSPRHQYAVHFLRESILGSKSAARTKLGTTSLYRCFPWGQILRSLIEETGMSVSTGDYEKIVNQLKDSHLGGFRELNRKLLELDLSSRTSSWDHRAARSRGLRLVLDHAREGIASVTGLPEPQSLRKTTTLIEMTSDLILGGLATLVEERYSLPKVALAAFSGTLHWQLKLAGQHPVEKIVTAFNTNRLARGALKQSHDALVDFLNSYYSPAVPRSEGYGRPQLRWVDHQGLA